MGGIYSKKQPKKDNIPTEPKSTDLCVRVVDKFNDHIKTKNQDKEFIKNMFRIMYLYTPFFDYNTDNFKTIENEKNNEIDIYEKLNNKFFVFNFEDYFIPYEINKFNKLVMHVGLHNEINLKQNINLLNNKLEDFPSQDFNLEESELEYEDFNDEFNKTPIDIPHPSVTIPNLHTNESHAGGGIKSKKRKRKRNKNKNKNLNKYKSKKKHN